MATGVEHYKEAERLLDAYKEAIIVAEALPADTPAGKDNRFFAASNARALIAVAAVHAELAKAAALTDAQVLL